MAQIISIHPHQKTPKFRHKPYQRVFYVGFRYVGPAFCQDVQRIYFKKMSFGRGCFQFYAGGMAWLIEEFAIEEFSSRLDELCLEDVISNEELAALGWKSDCEVIRFSKKLRWRHLAS